MEDKKAIAQEIVNTLGIAPLVRSIVIEKSQSPWSEKSLIKWKKDHLDVKAFIWDDPTYLYGRIYRLFLYIVDVLNPVFEYAPRISPDEEREPRARERYNQIWSIYVDSRMERLGIDNFYDRVLRKNIFIESEKDLPRHAAEKIFDTLWDRESFTYPEIIDYARDPRKIKVSPPILLRDDLDTRIDAQLKDPSVSKHLERIPSPEFRQTVNDIISFAAYHCKDTHIEAKYYGICFFYHRQIFLEFIPADKDLCYCTLFDAQKQIYETVTISDKTDIQVLQDLIKEKYGKIAKPDNY